MRCELCYYLEKKYLSCKSKGSKGMSNFVEIFKVCFGVKNCVMLIYIFINFVRKEILCFLGF